MPSNTNAAAAADAARGPVFRAQDFDRQLQALLNDGTIWLRTHWLQILVAFVVGALIVMALHGLRRLGARLCARQDADGRRGWGNVIGTAVVRTGNFFIVMAAAKLVVGYAGAPTQVDSTVDFLWTVASVFQAAIWAREIILGAVEHRTSSQHYAGEALVSAMGLIRLLVTFALFAIALVVVLDNLGVNVTGLVAGLGVGGIAIGLAAQGIFADLFAALAIIFDRPFRRGDTIAYDTTTGTVEEIGLKSTRIRSASGEERIISNKNLLNKEIQNVTRRDYRRVRFTLGLVQATSVEMMHRLPDILKEAVESEGRKFIRAGFLQFGASSFDFDVEFDSPEAAFEPFFDARHLVGLAIIQRLNEEGIELAYPTQMNLSGGTDGRVTPFGGAEMQEGRRPSPATG